MSESEEAKHRDSAVTFFLNERNIQENKLIFEDI